MRKREWVIIWPLYFDKHRSRSQGRRVSLSLSVSRPAVKDIVVVLKKLKLKYIVEEEKKHPSTWFEQSGRILVEKTMPKTRIIRMIAEQLVKYKSRSSRS